MLTNSKAPAIVDPILRLLFRSALLNRLSAYTLKVNREHEVSCERRDAIPRQQLNGHTWNGERRVGQSLPQKSPPHLRDEVRSSVVGPAVIQPSPAL
jgi:hypothetical protein